jgi:hypothetical protein
MTTQYRIRTQDYTESLIPDTVLDINDPVHALMHLPDTNQSISLSDFIAIHSNITTLPARTK